MKRVKVWLPVVIILALSLVPACEHFQLDTTSPEQGAAPQAVGRYYDFDDIQVPTSLKLNKQKSILFRVNNHKAGVLVFEDNVELESLVNFFVDSMNKDNWVLKSSFKYPKVALFFAKKGKTCIIHIIERTFSTEVEIWMAPSL